jgi:carbonic anhydrase/acetyltransferase-like protein (isoleucine patch superfamily)
MEIKHREMTPPVHPDAYVASTAVLSGQVSVGAGSCVLHGAVLTADGGSVEVGANSVIMEHAVLRGTPRHRLVVGNHVLAGPNSYLTGCQVDDEVFIATGADPAVGRSEQMRTAMLRYSGMLAREHRDDE